MSTRYVSEREQFGAKIGSFQSVSHRMADTWIDLMNLRLLGHSAAAMLDRQALATLEVLSAQAWSAEAGHRISASCQHVHGGMGLRLIKTAGEPPAVTLHRLPLALLREQGLAALASVAPIRSGEIED